MKQETKIQEPQQKYFDGEGLEQYERWFNKNYKRRLLNVIRSNNTKLVITELKKAIGLAEYLENAKKAERLVTMLDR